MSRRRVEMLQDCLSVLADAELADALAVIEALHHMTTWGVLKTLWRPCELPATARNNLAAEAAEREE